MIASGIISSGIFIYAYLSIVFFKQKLAMSKHMHFPFFVDNTLLKIILDVVRSAVGVLK